MRISRHDLRRRNSNSLVIDAGSHFTLRACSQANENLSMQQSFTLPRELLHTSMFLQKMWDMVDHRLAHNRSRIASGQRRSREPRDRLVSLAGIWI